MKDDLTKKLQIGLTSDEVRSLTEQGMVNGDLNVKTKTYGQIIKDNLFSLFNLKKSSVYSPPGLSLYIISGRDNSTPLSAPFFADTSISDGL